MDAQAKHNILTQGVRPWLTGVWKTKPQPEKRKRIEPEKRKRIAEIVKGLTEEEKWKILLAYVRAHFQKRMVQHFGGLRAVRLVQIRYAYNRNQERFREACAAVGRGALHRFGEGLRTSPAIGLAQRYVDTHRYVKGGRAPE